jgi:Fe2+ or Zn2+ uptake regulation protein
MGNPRDQRRAVQLREEELAEAILQYLANHSQAMDTLAGIAEWWIPRQRVRIEVNTVARVLRRLSEEGLLECQGTGENALYRLKRPDAACGQHPDHH